MNQGLWQNSGVRFNIDEKSHDLTGGESLKLFMENVQFIRGDNCEMGDVYLTNLRLIWKYHLKSGINICVGFSSVTRVDPEVSESNLDMFVTADYADKAYKLCFRPSSLQDHTHLYNTLMNCKTTYHTIRLCLDSTYSEENFDREGKLRLLNIEQSEGMVPGAWLLNKNENELGTVFVTTRRLIWCSNTNLENNYSVPFHRMSLARIYKRRHGSYFAIKTSYEGSPRVLGLKFFHEELQDHLCSIIGMYVAIAQLAPICGTTFEADDALKLVQREYLDDSLFELKTAIENEKKAAEKRETADSQEPGQGAANSTAS